MRLRVLGHQPGGMHAAPRAILTGALHRRAEDACRHTYNISARSAMAFFSLSSFTHL